MDWHEFYLNTLLGKCSCIRNLEAYTW